MAQAPRPSKPACPCPRNCPGHLVQRAAMPFGSSVDELLPEECDASTIGLLAVGCLLGLVLCFCGYRLYFSALAVFAFLLAFTAEAALGAVWLGQDPREQGSKKALVVVCGLLWGTMAAVLCMKLAKFVHMLIGFLGGAAIGAGMVLLVVYVSQQPINEMEEAEPFKGWEQFASVTVGVPVVLVVGCLCRGFTTTLLMGATAIGGAVVVVLSAVLLMRCAEVDMDVLGKNAVQAGLMAVLAAFGFALQYCTQPRAGQERERET
uniref:TM7S3/TM198-like domain-containing protein n=1 Tax=Pyrodinium bahamense TaxID=73915 RepID=A0A7S0FL56_9DINO